MTSDEDRSPTESVQVVSNARTALRRRYKDAEGSRANSEASNDLQSPNDDTDDAAEEDDTAAEVQAMAELDQALAIDRALNGGAHTCLKYTTDLMFTLRCMLVMFCPV